MIPTTIPYLGDPTRQIPVYPRIWAECVKRAKSDLEWAAEVALDEQWQKQASVISLESMHSFLHQTLDQRTRHHYGYWHLRANSVAGNIAVDPKARREWVEMGGELT